jgi:hypothetical protein
MSIHEYFEKKQEENIVCSIFVKILINEEYTFYPNTHSVGS